MKKSIVELHAESLNVEDDKCGYQLLYNLVNLIKDSPLDDTEKYLVGDILNNLKRENLYSYWRRNDRPMLVSEFKYVLALFWLLGFCSMGIVLCLVDAFK